MEAQIDGVPLLLRLRTVSCDGPPETPPLTAKIAVVGRVFRAPIDFEKRFQKLFSERETQRSTQRL